MVFADGSFDNEITAPWMGVCVIAPLGSDVPASASMLADGSDGAASPVHPPSAPSTAHGALPLGWLSSRP